MESRSRIRVATPDDAAAVRDIYAPFCESTAVTFEETPPTAAEVAERIESTLEEYPWLVCEIDGEVAGYAYAHRLRERRAYDWVVELSIYVAEDARQSGVGRALYESLFAVLERQGIRDAYAVTTLPNPETVGFHEKMGFERVGDFPAVGYTEDEWRDVAWWRRSIGEKGDAPDRPRSFAALQDDHDVDVESLVAAGDERLEQ
ncbi:GNAT family N-acetyltransferase [Halopiger xanaduensis]|uniref:Phosphinothricin acetyltransferase n=1 Tax=Halopiger xanaduensis (strain DSM 18323 / JCM 14033 / SH-6) TaxID=797210 RepID=F8DBW3_HALXS|nr:GNAT family N-acetyltransferase [Halopiger xanaduensis]AEH35939.1 Phosphinothricin acetyltransferase [Halopiger xanaduensis SH-6]